MKIRMPMHVRGSDAATARSPRPNRREVLALGVGAFVVASVPLARARRSRLVRRRAPVMGTLADIVVVHDEPRAAQRAIDAALDALRQVDRSMSFFRAASDVGRANRHAHRDGVTVSADTAAVLTEALRWADGTDGRFDPCLGAASALWDVTSRDAPPAAAAVRGLAGRRLYRALDVSTTGTRSAVRLHEAAARIDLGGIAKGHGVDLAVRALRPAGVRQALVNVGGDLYALGASEDGDAWRVGIRSPEDPGDLVGTVALEDAAVATSGDYERFFRHEGRSYHHLLDPETGAPRRNPAENHSVSIRAASCLEADAAATAAFGLAPSAARALIGRLAPTARIVSSV